MHGLMRAPEVVGLDPVADRVHRVLLAFETVPMDALLITVRILGNPPQCAVAGDHACSSTAAAVLGLSLCDRCHYNHSYEITLVP